MRKYELYDGRYLTNPDRATVYEVCDTLKEVRKNKHEYGTDTVIVEVELKKVGKTEYLETSSKIVK